MYKRYIQFSSNPGYFRMFVLPNIGFGSSTIKTNFSQNLILTASFLNFKHVPHFKFNLPTNGVRRNI